MPHTSQTPHISYSVIVMYITYILNEIKIGVGGGRKGTTTTHSSQLTKLTTIQDHPKEAHFIKLNKHKCNRTQWVYTE
jgi:hypothetical protein